MMRTPALSITPEQTFWERKLGYSHAVVAVVTMTTIGLILHALTGPIRANVASLLVFATIPLGAAIFVRVRRLDPWAQWLAGIPLAVVSTAVGLVFVLLGGVLPAGFFEARFGLPNLWVSWPFAMVALAIVTNLAACTAKRLWPLTYVNVVFTLTHAGLLIVFVASAVSAVILQRDVMVLFPARPVSAVVARDGSERNVPFTVTLRSFELEYFPPTVALATLRPGTDDFDVTAGSRFLETGLVEEIGPARVEVLRFLPKAVLMGDEVREVPWKTSAPVARVRATLPDGTSREGWVSHGSVDSPPAFVELSPNRVVAMSSPRPKRFTSHVRIEQDRQSEEVAIRVNEPKSLPGGITLYQLSYDEKMGAASNYSVLEVVEDRGIPWVYLGMGLLLLGTLLHLWNGVGKGGTK